MRVLADSHFGVCKTNIISTIVDIPRTYYNKNVCKTNIISTIVDYSTNWWCSLQSVRQI